jgi:5-methylcytosine-specific restriction protein A
MDNYHSAFLLFLEKGGSYKGPDGQLIVDFVEKELHAFIQQHINQHLLSIYDVISPEVINEWYTKVLRDPNLNGLNNLCTDIKYSDALNWYKRFLESDYNPDLIARKEAEKERIKQERKELKKKEKEKKQTVASTTTTQEKKGTARVKKIKKQELDENQREGAITQVSITRRERNYKLRDACINRYGYVCQCCGIDFEKIYGEIGREYIEVHHLFPISQTEGEHEVDPEKDLIPLCSNCHSMIHRLDGEEMTLDKLKSYYHGYDYKKDEVKDI